MTFLSDQLFKRIHFILTSTGKPKHFTTLQRDFHSGFFWVNCAVEAIGEEVKGQKGQS